jgi:hypothetical protein
MSSLSDTATLAQTGSNGAARKSAAKSDDAKPQRGTGDYVAKNPDGVWAIFSGEIDALRWACPPGACTHVKYGEAIPR